MKIKLINIEKSVKDLGVASILVTSAAFFLWLCVIILFLRLIADFVLSTPLGQ